MWCIEQDKCTCKVCGTKLSSSLSPPVVFVSNEIAVTWEMFRSMSVLQLVEIIWCCLVKWKELLLEFSYLSY